MPYNLSPEDFEYIEDQKDFEFMALNVSRIAREVERDAYVAAMEKLKQKARRNSEPSAYSPARKRQKKV